METRNRVIKTISEILSLESDTVTEFMTTSGLPGNIAEILGNVLPRKSELAECYKKALTGYSKRSLLDLNYSVKVIMASDTSSVVKIPVVNIELFIKDVNGMIERVVLEANKEELKALIDQLSHIEKVDRFYDFFRRLTRIQWVRHKGE